MENLSWKEKIEAIIEQEKRKREELEKIENWIKSELARTTPHTRAHL